MMNGLYEFSTIHIRHWKKPLLMHYITATINCVNL